MTDETRELLERAAKAEDSEKGIPCPTCGSKYWCKECIEKAHEEAEEMYEFFRKSVAMGDSDD